jgi:hypothetical protein
LDTDNRPILFFIEHTAEGETYKISKWGNSIWVQSRLLWQTV